LLIVIWPRGSEDFAEDWSEATRGIGFFVLPGDVVFREFLRWRQTTGIWRGRGRLQGLGIATLFVPVSQLAYSNLPKNQNNGVELD